MRTITGDCTVRFDGRRSGVHRGRVVTLVKPDNTVLVHDAEGYQPVAWLTRPERLSLTRDPVWLVAVDGDETLRLQAERDVDVTAHDSTPAGVPVGRCRCGGSLVRARGEVVCLDCDERFSLPNGATVIDDSCDCGLPRMRVERGDAFELCVDYECESLTDAVTERFDSEWSCPACDGDLEILRRGGLIAGCEQYPDCETGFAVPDGTVIGECECGLPTFDTSAGSRCLDSGCRATRP